MRFIVCLVAFLLIAVGCAQSIGQEPAYKAPQVLEDDCPDGG